LKTKNIFELDPERLATTDEHGHRIYLFPEDVKGFWKTRRTVFYWILIVVYLVLPWVYINGKPAFLMDLEHAEFTFFGSTFVGVEPILLFLFVAAGLFFVATVTSLYGRVWCGWACPQTVFIQNIFMKLESLVEGKARQRRALAEGPWTLNRIVRKSIKWILFTAVSLHISHTFIGYFVGPRELLQISMHPPTENFTLFLLTMTATSIILLDFGWFREQFCIIACPYGRMQSVIMDENSLVISYDAKRGEPRRGTPGVIRTDEGDCINCYNCVKVCPTGIDIRRGTQLECIACTQCIDACDDIMTKLKRPTGLISYRSENELAGKKRKHITPRSMVYVGIMTAFVSAFVYFLSSSSDLGLIFIRNKIPFQVTDSGQTVINQFQLKVSHQGSQEYKLHFLVKDQGLKEKINVVTPMNPTVVNTPEKKVIIFFKFSPGILVTGTRKVQVDAFDDISGKVAATKEVVLVGESHE
jgi:cytochrome c oxidase accessory protein FixG